MTCKAVPATLALLFFGSSTAFSPVSPVSSSSPSHQQQLVCRHNSVVAQSLEGGQDQEEISDEDGVSFINENLEELDMDSDLPPPPTPRKPLDGMEKAWRYAKKPLLSIGAKGATLTHGNSLRQLLEQHTVVKVKVNTRRFDNSLEQAFAALKDLAEQNGAPPGIELLQAREKDSIILFGWPGTRKRIEENEFPLPPKEEDSPKEE